MIQSFQHSKTNFWSKLFLGATIYKFTLSKYNPSLSWDKTNLTRITSMWCNFILTYFCCLVQLKIKLWHIVVSNVKINPLGSLKPEKMKIASWQVWKRQCFTQNQFRRWHQSSKWRPIFSFSLSLPPIILNILTALVSNFICLQTCDTRKPELHENSRSCYFLKLFVQIGTILMYSTFTFHQ